MGPAEKQIHVSNSLGAKVKADFLFHLYLYFSTVPISFSLQSMDSLRRDMLFASSYLPSGLSFPHLGLFLTPFLVPIKLGGTILLQSRCPMVEIKGHTCTGMYHRIHCLTRLRENRKYSTDLVFKLRLGDVRLSLQ